MSLNSNNIKSLVSSISIESNNNNQKSNINNHPMINQINSYNNQQITNNNINNTHTIYSNSSYDTLDLIFLNQMKSYSSTIFLNYFSKIINNKIPYNNNNNELKTKIIENIKHLYHQITSEQFQICSSEKIKLNGQKDELINKTKKYEKLEICSQNNHSFNIKKEQKNEFIYKRRILAGYFYYTIKKDNLSGKKNLSKKEKAKIIKLNKTLVNEVFREKSQKNKKYHRS